MRTIYSESDLVNYYNLKQGDRIVVPKSGIRLVQHHVLYLGYDEYGNHWISENVFGVGVVLTRVSDFFAANGGITRIEHFEGSDYERGEVAKRALKQLGRPYSLIQYNCEHHANHAIHNSVSSKQVANVAGVAIGLFAIAMLFRGK